MIDELLLTDTQGWVVEDSCFEDITTELEAMSGHPVEISLDSLDDRQSAELELCGIFEFNQQLPAGGIEVQVNGSRSGYLRLCAPEILDGRCAPGYIDGVFGGCRVIINRVSLRAFRGEIK